jgi:hypothetical protein
MALVNKKVSSKSRKMSRAITDSIYDTKYFENREKLLKNINYRRDLHSTSYFN